MTKKKKLWLGAGALIGAAALTIGGVSTAVAGGSGDEKGDEDTPLTGTTLTQASEAAITAAGGGEVIETEVSDESGYAYEVKVKTADGQEVEVQLDEAFSVVKTETEAAESDNEADNESGTESDNESGTESDNEANDPAETGSGSQG